MKYSKFIIPAVLTLLVIGFIFYTLYKNRETPATSNVLLLGATQNSTTGSANLQPQTNNKGGVTIEITPKDIIPGEILPFGITLTTHQGNLDFDQTKAALFDDNNTVYPPISWDGGSGGHHLSGTLIFPALPPETKNIKLIIKDVYGVPERIFEWSLK